MLLLKEEYVYLTEPSFLILYAAMKDVQNMLRNGDCASVMVPRSNCAVKKDVPSMLKKAGYVLGMVPRSNNVHTKGVVTMLGKEVSAVDMDMEHDRFKKHTGRIAPIKKLYKI